MRRNPFQAYEIPACRRLCAGLSGRAVDSFDQLLFQFLHTHTPLRRQRNIKTLWNRECETKDSLSMPMKQVARDHDSGAAAGTMRHSRSNEEIRNSRPAAEARWFKVALSTRRPVILILAGIIGTSAGHYLTPPEFLLWHGVFQRLYYLPVVYAAVAYGARGGLAAALVSGVLYIPHIVFTWSGMRHYAMEQYAEILMFFAVGVVTGILADREKRRRAELQKTTDELSRVYQELQHSFEQMRRADRLSAVGQLAAGLAHEIRNPLASIDGAAEVLQEGAEGEVKFETLRIIRQECARLNRLLTNLLDFARPRPPERRLVDVRQVLHDVADLVRHSAKPAIRFAVHAPEELPPLMGDKEQLTQVVLNLAINAAQAMPQGGNVTLSASERPRGVCIQVSDEGEAAAPEMVERIFDPFYTSKETGTGLGLSVAHQIVTHHGGTITARRNPDKGMTFEVFLPHNARI